MATIAQQLTDLLTEAAEQAGYGDAPFGVDPCLPTNDPAHGDYQSNFAFRLGKALRTNPRVVARAICDALPTNDLLAQPADVAGPGFINFRLADSFLAKDTMNRCMSSNLGAETSGSGKRMVIDYSSPNVAKRMHVGHLRSTIIGDAIARLYRFLGWEVFADNHIGDWGTQFGKLIVAWRNWKNEEAYEEDSIAELQRLYQLFSQKAAEDDELIQQARAETAVLQEDATSENRRLWEQFVTASRKEFDGLYERLNVVFDETYGESHYRDKMQGLVDELIDRGVAVKEEEGAVIVPFSPEDGKGLGKNPLLIRKTDGATLYGTSDLATIQFRRDEWNPDAIVYVTDMRQQLHFRQVFAAARKAGLAGQHAELIHVYFGMLKFADGAIAASRSGNVINLVDVLNTARSRAQEVVDENSAMLPEKEREDIAEAVGVGAVKYTDLSQNPQSDIIFDWERMLAMEGNTAPYLMYANARCGSIFRKAEIPIDSYVPKSLSLDHPTERDLAIVIARMPEVIQMAAAKWRPNLLADHLFITAKAFSRFYRECRVLHPDNSAAVTESRLALVFATHRALSSGMGLLGLKPLERM